MYPRHPIITSCLAIMSVCHLIMAFVSQWLDSNVFQIRRYTIPCRHAIIQYRFLSIIRLYPSLQ